MTSIGYARELVLPVEIAPRRSGEPVRLEAQIDLGVCSDICVPATVTVTLDLPQAVGRADPAIKAALRARPETAREAGVRRVACSVAPIRDGMRLTAEIEVPRLGGGEFAVFETADPGIWVAEADIRRDGNRLIAVTDMVGPGGAPFALDRSGITVTLLADGRAVELRGCPAP
jgi:DsbC/DsbD-like thiol-disulfide interchange protein